MNTYLSIGDERVNRFALGSQMSRMRTEMKINSKLGREIKEISYKSRLEKFEGS
jgi:hypothetical protein